MRTIINVVALLLIFECFGQTRIEQLGKMYNNKQYIRKCNRIKLFCRLRNRIITSVYNWSLDSVDYIVMPQYKIVKSIDLYSADKKIEDFIKIDKCSRPHFVFILKDGKFHGRLCSDDCNNSYIDDMSSIYKQSDGQLLVDFIKTLNPDVIFQINYIYNLWWYIKGNEFKVIEPSTLTVYDANEYVRLHLDREFLINVGKGKISKHCH